MKKKLQKPVQQKWSVKKYSIGVVGILALGVGFSSPLYGAEQSPKKVNVPNVRHELVPHVVLPETIQYNKIAGNLYSQPGLSKAGDYGMVSPYVATYVPFPSYQIPYSTEMKTVNQSVYPVSPKRLPLPAKKSVEDEAVTPEKSEPKSESDSDSALTAEEKDFSFGDMDVAPILLASNSEEVVQAVPLAAWNNNDVTQTGIFCAKPPKPPTAWSFSSPIFKVASVPTGAGNQAGYNGFINQFGPYGCATQVGFQPVGGNIGENGVPVPYPPFSMGQGIGNGLQTQVLPNGMVLLTVPPDHSRCGLFRCHGHSPRMMLLPPAPGTGMPAVPQPQPQMAPTLPGAMMLPSFPGVSGYAPMQAQYPFPNQYPFPTPYPFPAAQPQPQLMPVTAMTPLGLTVVGYQQIPVTNPLNETGMYGMGMISTQQLQALQLAQQSSGIPQQLQQSQQSAEGQDETGNELKVPLPINSQITNTSPINLPPTLDSLTNSYANPYSLYAQQFAAANQIGNAKPDMVGNAANVPAIPPMMFLPPQINYGYGNGYNTVGNSFGGVYMTPYGMMVMPSATPLNGYANNFDNGFNSFSTGYGLMPVGMQPNLAGFQGLGGQNAGMNQGGLNLSEVVQLVMLLNNNNNQRYRPRLFERIAMRREQRRELRTQNDPLNQLMQAWTTPYMSPTDSTVRMPSRNAYPYGYFGAQPGQQNTANYGGYYNLYMGNTNYPGLY
ncbi:MAG: hypothetical protein LBF88_05740 [Planctomycetaceae bacterium]|jgi:hypothetical protein|nr:hypothetical protein [Planctomycetaceae bacterium]